MELRSSVDTYMIFPQSLLTQIFGYGPFERRATTSYDTDDYGLDDNFYAQIVEPFWYKKNPSCRFGTDGSRDINNTVP
jgi:hypothetical protein